MRPKKLLSALKVYREHKLIPSACSQPSNSSFKRSDALFWLPEAPGTSGIQKISLIKIFKHTRFSMLRMENVCQEVRQLGRQPGYAFFLVEKNGLNHLTTNFATFDSIKYEGCHSHDGEKLSSFLQFGQTVNKSASLHQVLLPNFFWNTGNL